MRLNLETSRIPDPCAIVSACEIRPRMRKFTVVTRCFDWPSRLAERRLPVKAKFCQARLALTLR